MAHGLDPTDPYNSSVYILQSVHLSNCHNVDLYSVPIFVSQFIEKLYTTPFVNRFRFCLALVCFV